jgi:hypothetical protein
VLPNDAECMLLLPTSGRTWLLLLGLLMLLLQCAKQ